LAEQDERLPIISRLLQLLLAEQPFVIVTGLLVAVMVAFDNVMCKVSLGSMEELPDVLLMAASVNGEVNEKQFWLGITPFRSVLVNTWLLIGNCVTTSK
jgi:hypothetical protein